MAAKGPECIGIGLLGLGVVGSGVAQSLMFKAEGIGEQVGCPVILKKVLVRTLRKKRPLKLDPSLITTDSNQILDDPNIAVVVEVMGGEEPAHTYIQRALRSRKHVVTANKEVMAKHSSNLLRMAEECGVGIFYEASVGGGIPLIGPLKRDLVVNRVSSIYAIINGTTNYILSKMSSEGVEFNAALRVAQDLGFAESDPANDIEGTDAAYKLAILAGLAFRAEISARDVYREGITGLTEHDFRYAKELGYAIKLLAIGTDLDDAIEVRVHPVFIPESFLLAKVEGVYNAVQIEGDMIGKVLFYGEGAGAMPTSSAVIGDIITAGRSIVSECGYRYRVGCIRSKVVSPMSQIETRYYVRMSILDQPGVLSQIAKVLGDWEISISSVIQKEADPASGTAEIVIMTHRAREESMQRALTKMRNLRAVKEIGSFIRVEV